MDQFGPTGKVSKKRVHLLRWTTFPGRTGWNFGWMDRALYFNRFKRSWFLICDWWISIRFVCFCVSRFVVCDRNYDCRQRKTQLWRRLLNFRDRMFVQSAVMVFDQPHLEVRFKTSRCPVIIQAVDPGRNWKPSKWSSAVNLYKKFINWCETALLNTLPNLR